MQWLLRSLVAIASAITAVDGRGSQADGAPDRSTSRSVDAGGTTLTVFEYRPSGCRTAGLFVVFHGRDRNASDYRDHARPIADRLCLVVAAPLLDERRFPTWRYQRGGVVERRNLLPATGSTVALVAPLVMSLQSIEGTSGQPFYLLGHSAGAQFLSRVAAYTSSAAARIVIANPSTHVLPDVAEAVPYGFGGLPRARERLRDYLARPVTLLLGDDDVGDKNLAEGAAALRQGATRLERGRQTFRMAQAAARERLAVRLRGRGARARTQRVLHVRQSPGDRGPDRRDAAVRGVNVRSRGIVGTVSAATPWPAIRDAKLFERMIPAFQRAIVASTVGSDAEPTGDAPVQLNLPDTANVLLMVLATVLEPAPDCATPRGTRLLAEAAGKELALLIQDTRALKAAQEAETGPAH